MDSRFSTRRSLAPLESALGVNRSGSSALTVAY